MKFKVGDLIKHKSFKRFRVILNIIDNNYVLKSSTNENSFQLRMVYIDKNYIKLGSNKKLIEILYGVKF